MESISFTREREPDAFGGLNGFIGASRRASQRGDYEQAERLLKTSLMRAEKQMVAIHQTVIEILESLIDVYELKGEMDEVLQLRTKLNLISRQSNNTTPQH